MSEPATIEYADGTTVLVDDIYEYTAELTGSVTATDIDGIEDIVHQLIAVDDTVVSVTFNDFLAFEVQHGDFDEGWGWTGE